MRDIIVVCSYFIISVSLSLSGFYEKHNVFICMLVSIPLLVIAHYIVKIFKRYKRSDEK
ncbi:hypothetical protein [Staphylococcus gallinarum]|uniref:Uncharacterized protein n=1 Tax=Staphylococcus gallinarum TaxID=1293 RepID=A0A380FCJ4_STAGA|nr:hypothetical protein [Staphylococcus gallinarum]SUM31181.1 Uncharacterised protein [Staphylococcus gallinarum]